MVIGYSSRIFLPKRTCNQRARVSTKIYDRNNNLLYTIYKDKNRTPVKLTQIPENVKLATLAAEDAEFYNHIDSQHEEQLCNI